VDSLRLKRWGSASAIIRHGQTRPGIVGDTMDDRTRYEAVKSRLRAMGEGTSQQVHDSMEPSPYSVREVESTLAELVVHEKEEFEKVDNAYRWKKHYRFRTR
jgi:hypothetical protein